MRFGVYCSLSSSPIPGWNDRRWEELTAVTALRSNLNLTMYIITIYKVWNLNVYRSLLRELLTYDMLVQMCRVSHIDNMKIKYNVIVIVSTSVFFHAVGLDSYSPSPLITFLCLN